MIGHRSPTCQTRQPPGPPSGRWGVDGDNRRDGPFRGGGDEVSICPQALESASTLYQDWVPVANQGSRRPHIESCRPLVNLSLHDALLTHF